jgi:membrane dipeptidase
MSEQSGSSCARRVGVIGMVVWTLGAASWSAQSVAAGAGEPDWAAVHAATLTLDAHLDLPAALVRDPASAALDGAGQVDLPKMERGGLDAAVFTVFAWQQARTAEEDARAVATGRAQLAALQRTAELHSARIGIARSAAAVESLVARGRKAAVIGLLNATMLGPEGGLLDEYHAAGLRQLGFTHAGHNAYADSSRPSARNGDAAELWGGLSPLGRRLVPRLNELGIVIDVSQLSSAALAQVLQLSRAPVVASHSAARARVDNPRNLPDEEIRAIAARGGVICVVAFSSYLRAPPESFSTAVAALRGRYGVVDEAGLLRLSAADSAAYQREYLALVRALPSADLGHWGDAIDHVVRVAGIDHVGLSTDFEHAGGVDGYRNAGEAGAVTRELLRRGYSPEQVAKIWGGNWLRVFREVEQLSVRNPGPGAG